MGSRNANPLPGQRQLRVGEELRHALAEVLADDGLRDPELKGKSITISEVRASPDLRHATAYIVPFGDGDAPTLVTALRRATPFLRRRVAQLVQLKFAPDIRFEIDTRFDNDARINRLLRSSEITATRPRTDVPEGDG